MEDRPRSDSGSPLQLSSASRSRSHSPPPRSQSEAISIQVHEDGLVQFSVSLADVDAEQLASLVAAVRSSARPPSRRSNYALRRGSGSDGPVSSPDLLSAQQDMFGNKGPLPLPNSPRLPDRAPSTRSAATALAPSKLPAPAVAIAAADDGAERSAWAMSTKRSISTPDLRADIARLAAKRASDDSNPALRAKPGYDDRDVGATRYKFADEAEDPMKPARPFPENKLNEPTAEDLGKNWREVEYELTEKYRSSEDGTGSGPSQPVSSGPALATHRTFHAPPSAGSRGRSSSSGSRRPWRLFSQLGARIRRRAPADPYVPARETIVKGGSLSSSGTVRKGAPSGSDGVKVGATGNGGPWLEFATLLAPEQALAELARFAKLRGFQVWRRPGEHKLRCIRKLSSSQEMHLVIFVESQVHAPTTLVRIRRARGDRGKTEWWRFSHFHRDVIARFSATGLSVLPTEPPPMQQTGLSFHGRA